MSDGRRRRVGIGGALFATCPSGGRCARTQPASYELGRRPERAVHAVAAIVFTSLVSLAVLFQVALAAGMPWGELAMGGAHPGRLPPRLRAAAVVQGALLAGFAVVVLSEARLFLPALAERFPFAIWIVAAFSAVSMVLNLVTPSRKERLVWGPVATLLFVTSAVVAWA